MSDTATTTTTDEETDLKEVDVRRTGTIKAIVYERGFLFVTVDDLTKGGKPVEAFLHQSGLEGGYDTFQQLKKGDKLMFTLTTTEKGQRAEHAKYAGN